MEALRHAIESRNVVFIAGSGISAAVTNGQPTATWIGLIKSGRDRVVRVKPQLLEKGWDALLAMTLDYGVNNRDTQKLVQAAGMVKDELNKSGLQAFADWLADDIGKLPVKAREVATALLDMPFPILTTNYDTLLETIGGRRSACWTSHQSIQRVLGGGSNDIGHIHGVWNEPDSVVLSEPDYGKVVNSEAVQSLLRAASSIKSIVYVGFGSGLDDPNFASLLDWHRRVFAPSAVPHFRLCRNGDVAALEAYHASDNIRPIPYGEDYDGLPHFLMDLAPARSSLQLTGAGIARDVVAEAQQALLNDLRSEVVIAEEAAPDREVAELVLPPILLPVPHAEFVKAKSRKNSAERFERLDPAKEVQECDSLIVVADEGQGLTTALKWMVLNAAASLSGVAPIYVNFGSCRRVAKPLEEQVRHQARTLGILQGKGGVLPSFALALDDMAPHVQRISDRVIEELSEKRAVFTVVGCRSGREEDLLDRLRNVGVDARVRYLGKLGRRDITALAKIASPVRYREITDSVYEIVSSENLPRTPFTVSLLISILLRDGTLAASVSQTAVLEQYVSLLLGRGDPHEDARFTIDRAGREMLLENLAERFVEQNTHVLPETEVVFIFESVFSKLGWPDSPAEMLTNLIGRRVLKRVGNSVQFSRASYLYLFAAKRAMDSKSLRDALLARPLYYSSVLMPYAALTRKDLDLLGLVHSLIEPARVDAEGGGSPYQRIPLEMPRDEASEDKDGEGDGDDERSDVADDDDALGDGLLDIVDVEHPAFPPDEDYPPLIRLMKVLELASSVLRDADQVEELDRKRTVLVDVLTAWGSLVGALSADRSFRDLVGRIAEDLHAVNLEDGEAKDPYLEDELTRTIPASIALGGIDMELASRKLLVILASALKSGELTASEETIVGAAFLIYAIREEGWPGQLRTLLAGAPNIWIIRKFVLWLCTEAYADRAVSKADDKDLLELCLEIVERGNRYESHAAKTRHLDMTRQRLDRLRLRRSRSIERG